MKQKKPPSPTPTHAVDTVSQPVDQPNVDAGSIDVVPIGMFDVIEPGSPTDPWLGGLDPWASTVFPRRAPMQPPMFDPQELI